MFIFYYFKERCIPWQITEFGSGSQSRSTQEREVLRFAIAFSNNARGGYSIKDIDTTCFGQKCPDGNSSLELKSFHVGDFLDIVITLPPKQRSDATG